MKWQDCKALIGSDVERMRTTVAELKAVHVMRRLSFWLMPEISALMLYRLSHYLLQRGWSGLATVLYRTNITMTGVDIPPETVIGPRCLLVHPVGTVIHGRLGADVTVYARVLVEPSQFCAPLEATPQLGDGVVLGSMCSVLGPVTIGPRVHIAPGSLIDSTITDSDCLVSRLPGERPAIVKAKTKESEDVQVS
jgi:serine O-acetyltransferase